MQIRPGQKVGICGRTGYVHFKSAILFLIRPMERSGKSTIIMALLRAVNQSLMSGTILIDGVDIQTIPLRILRQSLRYVHLS